MIKVFLVEDEFVVREGIKNNIDWEANGYEFCGEAGDGELAFPMIQKCKPDIVITDIKMPFMDGLALSRLIKKELPETEIIVLTGYQEFGYAKEGIEIGIAQYLSKPISGAELLKEVNTVAEKIKEKKQEKELREKYLLEMQENIRKERKELFTELISGNLSMAEMLEKAEKLDLSLSALWYNVVLVIFHSEHHEYEEFSNSTLEIEEALETMGLGKCVVFDRNLEGKALLFMADSKEELLEIQMSYLEELKEALRNKKHIRYFGGIGKPVERLRELSISFEHASRAFAHRYLSGKDCFLDSENIAEQVNLDAEDFNLSSVRPRQVDRTKFKEFLMHGDSEEAVYFIEEYFHELGKNALESTLLRQYIAMDAYFCVVDFLEGLQIQKEEFAAFEMDQSALGTVQGAMEYMVRIVKNAVEIREQKASNRYGDVVWEVVHYIEEHYMEEELSLNQLASHVNFSPNHLSMVFSQQTGQTFIKYLTDYRMNKAKELLSCSGKKSSEIGIEVGYRNPHYFSYMFKKTQGMTPTQYRMGKLSKEN